MILNYSVRPSLVAKRFEGVKLRPTGTNQLISKGDLAEIFFEPESGRVQVSVDENDLRESLREAEKLFNEKKLPLVYEKENLLTYEEAGADSALMESLGFEQTDKDLWEWKGHGTSSLDSKLES